MFRVPESAREPPALVAKYSWVVFHFQGAFCRSRSPLGRNPAVSAGAEGARGSAAGWRRSGRLRTQSGAEAHGSAPARGLRRRARRLRGFRVDRHPAGCLPSVGRALSFSRTLTMSIIDAVIRTE